MQIATPLIKGVGESAAKPHQRMFILARLGNLASGGLRKSEG